MIMTFMLSYVISKSHPVVEEVKEVKEGESANE